MVQELENALKRSEEFLMHMGKDKMKFKYDIGESIFVDFGEGKSGHVPPIIEKCPCFH